MVKIMAQRCIRMSAILLIASGGFSQPAVSLHEMHYTQQVSQQSPKKSLRKKSHTVHLTRPLEGAPIAVSLSPAKIYLPEDYDSPDVLPIDQHLLDLESLTPAMLKQLSPQELQHFMAVLAAIPIKITWLERNGKLHKIKKKHANAAAGIALKVGAISLQTGVRYMPRLFASMVSLNPDATLPAFLGLPANLFDTQVSARIIALLLKRLEHENSKEIAQSIGLLTELHIKPRAHAESEEINNLLRDLIEASQKLNRNHETPHPEQAQGILLGSIVAGTMKYAQSIKNHDERRLWIINSVSNIVWAATTFIGMAPIASSVAAATGGGISMAVVVGALIYGDAKAPRDFTPTIKTVQGQIEFEILEATKSMNHQEKVDVVLMLTWMRAAIHVNGYSD